MRQVRFLSLATRCIVFGAVLTWAFVFAQWVGKSEADAGRAGRHAPRGDAQPDPQVPPAWAGEWTVTISYRNLATDNLSAVDEIIDFLCAGEPFGLSLFAGLADCSGAASDDRLEVNCSTSYSDATCDITGSMSVAVDRSGDSLSGSGQWSATTVGVCDPARSGGETIAISGVRLSGDQSACGSIAPSLARRFVLVPAAVGFLAIGDCDEDGFASIADHTAFSQCMDGPGVDADSSCACADVNLDRRVDLRDFALFQRVFSIP